MHYWIALIGALAPALVLMAVAWSWLFGRQNAALFWVAVGLGTGVVVATVLIQVPFLLLLQSSGRPTVLALLTFFVLLSLLEEIIKFGGFRIGLAFFGGLTAGNVGLVTGIAAIVALTFAGIENALFNLGIAGKIGAVFWPMLLVRAVATVPLHATCGLLMGLAWQRTEGGPKRGLSRWMVVLALPIALHVLFNLIQLIGVGFRMPGSIKIGTGQWVGIAAAAVLVYISAWLAIRGINRLRQSSVSHPTAPAHHDH